MATFRLRYEIKPSTLHPGRFTVIKLRGRIQLGYIAAGLSKRDAVDFKKMKETQSEVASVRNRRANRKQRIAGVASFMAHGVATLADGSTIG